MLPVELKKAVQLLSEELNWKIVELLAEKGKVTWQGLLDGSGVHAKMLNFQLQRLVSAGIVDRYEVGRTLEGNTGILSFDLSPLGKNVIQGLATAYSNSRQ